MTPSSGKVGTKVTLSIVSSSFSLEGDYEVRWSPSAAFNENKTLVLKKGTAPKNTQSVSVIFIVPESRYGIHYVQFMSLADKEPINIQFMVQPHITTNQLSAKSGDIITMKGTGFPSNDSGTLFFDDKPTSIKAITNINGSFELRFVVPTTSSGKHTLYVDIPIMHPEAGVASIQVLSTVEQKQTENNQDLPASTNKTNSEITYTNQATRDTHPPDTPIPIMPTGNSFGIWGAKEIRFSWSEVTDISGVTYNLQISRTTNFDQADIGSQLTGLSNTNYGATLAPGIYYWRIKAIDGAGNESYWGYSRYAFRVGELSHLIAELKSAITAIFASQYH